MSRKTELEKATEDKWLELVHADECMTQKGELFGDGYPDQLCLTPYKLFYWMEFKRYDGHLDERQMARIEELRSIGQTVYVVSDVQAAKFYHREEMENAKKLHAYLSCKLKYG